MFVLFIEQEPGFNWIGWLQVVVGFTGVLVAALISVYVAKKNIMHQTKSEAIRNTRLAVSELIQAVHNLAQLSKDPRRNNELDRNIFYRQAVLFELSVSKDLDQDRFNAAINWLLKASALRYDFAQAETKPKKQFWDRAQHVESLPASHGTFLDRLTHRTTVALRDFDHSGDVGQLVDDLAHSFGKIYDSAGLKGNPKVERLFTSGKSIYKRLIGSQPEYSSPDGPINLNKAYS